MFRIDLATKLIHFLAVAGLVVATASYAQDYPTRPVRIIVPFAAGGSNDIVGRMLAQKLSEALHQQFVVDNRAGAAGNIGTYLAAKAAPDGYTLLSGGMGSLVANPAISKVPYDTVRDFAPITLIARAPNVLVLHPSVPAQNVAQLIALARARPGQLNYGSGGVGSTPHLSGALFAMMAGIELNHVPYKGAAPAVVDLIAGHVQLVLAGIPIVLPHLSLGKLKAIAVTGLERSLQLPNIPTVSESGLKGYDVNPWYGLLAPAGTPIEILSRLHAECRKALTSPAMKEHLLRQGAEADGSAPAEFAGVIRADLKKWSDVAQQARIRAD
ncbi:MAG TPA: tripartite tricarboxylate transporter substrate binding protein [Burkholderiales bacterium]